MAIIAKYKFNPILYADYLPTFNTQFTGYTKTDVTNTDGTITRTISHDTLKPTSMRFGSYDGVITNKVKSLLEVIECDTSNITTMSNMFRGCSNLILLNTSNFDTSNVTTMSCLFHDCSSLTSLDLSKFNTSQVTTMNNMFFNCSSLISLDLSSFNTSQVTDMVAMFYDCTKLTSLDLSNFDTGKVTNMNSMFYNCPVSNIRLLYATSSTINSLLTPLDTSVARTIYYQQASLSDLTKQNNITYVLIEPTPIAKYKFNSSLYADYLPVFNTEFTGYRKTDVNNGDGTITRTISHDTLKPTIMRFGNTSSITDREKSLLEVIECDTSKVTSMVAMFKNCSKLTLLDLSSFNTSNVTAMNSMFEGCASITTLDLSNFNTSNVTDMRGMFYNCNKLTSLVLSSFNTSEVDSMTYMFYGCNKLTSLDLSSFNTSNVTAMNNMFDSCSSLTSLDLSNFNTSSVNNMSCMFQYCSSLTSLDLTSFNTSEVDSMYSMFSYCNKLTSLDVSNFNTSNVTDMHGMFYDCSKLISLDVSNFNTSNVTTMRGMFSECKSLALLDISNFNTSKVTTMEYIFNSCAALSDIGLIYASSSTINSLLTHLGTSVARNIYYMDAPLSELTVQDNITYIKYELSRATFPYTLNKLPNGVADYIDVVNKVHVQRVGVLSDLCNNFTGWYRHNESTSEMFVAAAYIGSFPIKSIGMVDKVFTPRMSVKEPYSIYVTGGACIITIPQSDLTEDGVSVFRNKLAEINPTILYELATPIYTPLTEEEIAQLPLSAYKDGYVNLSSDQLTPSFEFRMRASNHYQVDMLETGYYYLNAPVGNVKLGTANVDVQQMPCIVKVDNVGTGDSGYRLGINGHTSFLSFDKSNFTLGYYYGLSGELLASGRDCAYEEYIPISTGDSILINQLYYTQANPYNVSVILYDSNKTMIKQLQISKATPQKVNTANVAYFRFSCIHDRTVTEPTTKVAEVYINPVTLTKLPSHRIPTSFTQGMRCTTDFGYWEGVKVAIPTIFKTVNRNDWSNIEESWIDGGNGIELNRIEGDYQGNVIVEDEFDFGTGKLIKRVGKVVLDGSIFIYDFKNIGKEYTYMTISGDRMGVIFKNSFGGGSYGLAMSSIIPFKVNYAGEFEHMFVAGGNLIIIMKTNELGIPTKEGIAKYFEANPMTVYYELAVPEISYVPLSLNQVKTIANTALQCNARTGCLRPQVKPSHLTYPVPSLVGNRTYTVVHNRKNITGSTKPIELNLGGTVVQLNDASSKTLVKTPSTLAHSNLIFIGGESTVDHIMVLDGDWTNKPIEYFENMKGHDTDAIITIIGDGKIDDVAEQYLW